MPPPPPLRELVTRSGRLETLATAPRGAAAPSGPVRDVAYRRIRVRAHLGELGVDRGRGELRRGVVELLLADLDLRVVTGRDSGDDDFARFDEVLVPADRHLCVRGEQRDERALEGGERGTVDPFLTRLREAEPQLRAARADVLRALLQETPHCVAGLDLMCAVLPFL